MSASAIQVTNGPDSPSGSTSLGKTVSSSLTLAFLVVMSEYTNDSLLVENANAGGGGAVPAYGHMIGARTLVSKTAKQNPDDPLLWGVTATYQFPEPGVEAAPASPDPDGERWAIVISGAAAPYDVEIQYDVNNKQILNELGSVAGDAIEGIITQDHDEDITVEFTTNVIDWAGIDAAMPDGKPSINDADITLTINGQTRTFAAGTLRFVNYQWSYTKDPSGITYPRVIYVLRYRARGWARLVANKGFNYNKAGVKTAIPNANSAQYLSAAGAVLSPGDDAVIINSGLGVNIYQEVDLLTLLLWDIGT